MLHSVLAVGPQWCILSHVSYMGMLAFPDSWNSSCSSLKGLITSLCSSAPLYESARKAEQAEGQQRQPAYSKARDTGGDNITHITKSTHMHTRAHGQWAHACTLMHTSTVLIFSYTHMPCWRAKKKKSYIMDASCNHSSHWQVTEGRKTKQKLVWGKRECELLNIIESLIELHNWKLTVHTNTSLLLLVIFVHACTDYKNQFRDIVTIIHNINTGN